MLPAPLRHENRAPRLRDRERCWRCWQPTRPIRFSPGEYAELFGLYLGDGHITQTARTQRLRISLDPRHPRIVDEARALLVQGFPANRVQTVRLDGGRTTVLSLYSNHLACLFPQHGAGKKHERPITIEPWQLRLLEEAPWSFIRGCMQSDGCFFINRPGKYRYLSAEFSNASADIRALLMLACDVVGLEYRETARAVRFYRRDTVRELAAFVGSKW